MMWFRQGWMHKIIKLKQEGEPHPLHMYPWNVVEAAGRASRPRLRAPQRTDASRHEEKIKYSWMKTCMREHQTAKDNTRFYNKSTKHKGKFGVSDTLKFKTLFSKRHHQ